MNSLQKLGAALVTTGALSACVPASVSIVWDEQNPSKVEILFGPNGKAYAKCVDKVLDAKWYSGLTHSQPTLNVPVSDCKMSTIKATLEKYNFTDISSEIPTN